MRLTPFVVAPYYYRAHQVDMMVGMVLVVRGGYGGASAEAPNVTTEELRELFGGIGQIMILGVLESMLQWLRCLHQRLPPAYDQRFHQTPDKFGAIYASYSDILESLNFQVAY